MPDRLKTISATNFEKFIRKALYITGSYYELKAPCILSKNNTCKQGKLCAGCDHALADQQQMTAELQANRCTVTTPLTLDTWADSLTTILASPLGRLITLKHISGGSVSLEAYGPLRQR